MKLINIVSLSLVLFFTSLSFSIGKENLSSCPSILDHELRILDSNKTENLCKYKDKVVLAVNVASRCGFTYQYESLQALFKNYEKDDFVILGFPSRDFMFQEYSDEGDVKEFCSTNYGVSFPLFATSSVTGKKANPFYKQISKEFGSEPAWNFTKYLISKKGKVVNTFSSKVEPNSPEVIRKLESLL
jgi:glutathione peroxidase